MTSTANAAASRSGPLSRGLAGEVLSRFRGPGGYYNVGNLIGLFSGLALQFATAATSGLSGTDAVAAYLVGSPATVALTAATIIFLASGEMYYRAWRGGIPDDDLNRLADLLSAVGGTALAISLLYLGQPMLATFTGILIVLGKLGSAAFGDEGNVVPFWPWDWPAPFRSMVLAGRLPAIAAAGLELGHQLGTGGAAVSVIQPAVLVLCHLLWMRADFLLFRSSRPAAAEPDPY